MSDEIPLDDLLSRLRRRHLEHLTKEAQKLTAEVQAISAGMGAEATFERALLLLIAVRIETAAEKIDEAGSGLHRLASAISPPKQ